MALKVKAVEKNIKFEKNSEGVWRYVMQPDLYIALSQAKVIREAALRSGVSQGVMKACWDAAGEVIKAWATEVDRTDHREYRIGYSNGPRSNKLHGAISKSKKGQAIKRLPFRYNIRYAKVILPYIDDDGIRSDYRLWTRTGIEKSREALCPRRILRRSSSV